MILEISLGATVIVVPVVAAAVALHRARERRQGRARPLLLLPCQAAGELHVRVWSGPQANAVRLPGVKVVVVETGLYAYSPHGGGDVVLRVRPGQYNLRAEPCGWCLPRAPSGPHAVVAGGVAQADLELDDARFHIHVDADRDGVVDAATAPVQAWTWGPAGQGAVIPCNSDADGDPNTGMVRAARVFGQPAAPADAAPDLADDRVNGANDVDDLAPLELRRAFGVALPASWTTELRVLAGAAAVRVFQPRSAVGARVLGAGAGAAPLLTALPLPSATIGVATTLDFGIEATQHAGHGFDGAVQIELTMRRPAEGFASSFRAPVQHRELVHMRVAPWMVSHHLDPAIAVHVADVLWAHGGTNAAFRLALGALTVAAGAGAPIVPPAQTDDAWMQDCIEIGYSTVPRAAPPPLPVAPVAALAPPPVVVALPPAHWPHPPPMPPRPPLPPLAVVVPGPLPAVSATVHVAAVVANLPRSGALAEYADSLVAPDFGELVGLGHNDHSASFGGNIEATPPARHPTSGKAYPWGRIYFSEGRPGETLPPELRGLLVSQIVQPHVELDATWLIVNHVDEIISFVPRASADPLRAFALLIASPRRAYELLWSAHQAGHGGATMLTGRHFGPAAAQLTVDEYLGQGGNLSAGLLGANLFLRASAVPPTAADYLQWNNTCQARLDAVLAALAAEIEIPQVIEIPMLFMPVDELPSGTQLFCAATPGSVNMLVLNGHCIIPDPFGPMLPAGDLFQACMRNELEALGLTVNFIDDWDYHSQVGDVHCATNTRRIPQQGRVAWWGYVP